MCRYLCIQPFTKMSDMHVSVYTAFHKNVNYAGIYVYSASQKCKIFRYLCIQRFTKMPDMHVSVYTAFHKNVRYAGICVYSLSQKFLHSNNFLHIFAVLINNTVLLMLGRNFQPISFPLFGHYRGSVITCSRAFRVVTVIEMLVIIRNDVLPVHQF
jgi:hypothetical protein